MASTLEDGRQTDYYGRVYRSDIKALKDCAASTALLYMVLITFVAGNVHRATWPGARKLGDAAGCSRPTVFRNLLELEKVNLLTRQRTGRSNRYTLHRANARHCTCRVESCVKRGKRDVDDGTSG